MSQRAMTWVETLAKAGGDPNSLKMSQIESAPGPDGHSGLSLEWQSAPGEGEEFVPGSPIYEFDGASPANLVRIGHRAIGWRDLQDYLVAFYKREGSEISQIAAFVIVEDRTRMTKISIER
jgi:hypothetical protein